MRAESCPQITTNTAAALKVFSIMTLQQTHKKNHQEVRVNNRSQSLWIILWEKLAAKKFRAVSHKSLISC